MNMDQHQFSVQVKVTYLPDESDAENRQFAFAYTITIKNTGQNPGPIDC
jgi:ApaG protein